MKNRGFTLIELLAVIAILAIVFLIAIPIITDTINQTRIKAYVSNNKMFLKSADLYISNNPNLLPTAIGEKIEVSLQTLKSQNYITNMNIGSQNCDGYIMITNIGNNNYDYSPHINCNENIGDSVNNKLIFHYKFKDFQEPTENVYPRGSNSLAFSSAYNGSLYSFGVNTNMQQVIDNSMQFDNRASVTKVSRIDSGLSQRDYVSINLSSPLNSVRVLTFWYYGTYGTNIRPYNNDSSANLYYLNSSGNWIGGATGVDIPVEENKWQKIVIKIENRGLISGTGLSWMILHNNQITATLDNSQYWAFSLFQYEQKQYATPYTPNTRLSLVTDYSNNNNSTLGLTTTPKWIDEHYEFNNNQFIQTPYSFTGTNNYSLSLWVYRFNDFPAGVYNRFIGTQTWGVGRFGLMIDNTGQLAMNTYFGGSYDYWMQSSITPPFNEWFHVASTFDRNGLQKLYYNGELVASINISAANSVNWVNDFVRISCGSESGIYTRHSGKIDDIRLYQRLLQEEEIKRLYNLEKK